jgi:hypothetical protein
MSKVRFIVVPMRTHWTIRRASRRFGSFVDETQAISMALQLAVIQSTRGEMVQVLRQDANGRWDDLAPGARRGQGAAVLL